MGDGLYIIDSFTLTARPDAVPHDVLLEVRTPISACKGATGRLLNQLPEMLIIAQPGKLQFVNQGVVEFTGANAGCLLGQDPEAPPETSLLHLIHPDDGAVVAGIFEAYAQQARAKAAAGGSGVAPPLIASPAPASSQPRAADDGNDDFGGVSSLPGTARVPQDVGCGDASEMSTDGVIAPPVTLATAPHRAGGSSARFAAEGGGATWEAGDTVSRPVSQQQSATSTSESSAATALGNRAADDTDGCRAPAPRSHGMLRREPPTIVEYRVRSAAGGYRWVRASVARLPCAENAPGQVELIFRCVDIQEVKELQSQLEGERNVLRAVLHHLPVGACVVSPRGDVTLMNRELVEVWRGNTRPNTSMEEYDQWVGFHPDGRRYEVMDWPMARSLTSGEVISNEEHIIGYADGTRGVVRLSTVPVYGGDGKLVAGVLVGQNVTHEKEMEEQRARLAASQQAADAMRALMVGPQRPGRCGPVVLVSCAGRVHADLLRVKIAHRGQRYAWRILYMPAFLSPGARDVCALRSHAACSPLALDRPVSSFSANSLSRTAATPGQREPRAAHPTARNNRLHRSAVADARHRRAARIRADDSGVRAPAVDSHLRRARLLAH
jgi:PAS domain-containing protein